jgi:hypothetical protein
MCNVSTDKNSNGVSNFDISPMKIAFPSKHRCNWIKKFARVLALTSIGCNSIWIFAPESYLILTRLGLHILPFFRGLDNSSDHFVGMCFPGDGIRFWGQSQPKFQDFNANSSLGEISNCLKVSSWVFIPLISLMSSIFLLNSTGVCQKCIRKTLLFFLT